MRETLIGRTRKRTLGERRYKGVKTAAEGNKEGRTASRSARRPDAKQARCNARLQSRAVVKPGARGRGPLSSVPAGHRQDAHLKAH